MYTRLLATVLERYSTIFRILEITGPRQSGKTTLAKILFSHLPYVSFENLNNRTRAKQDCESFLKQYKEGAIFDEAQHVPELFSHLQVHVDEVPEKGKYVLTGSQNFLLNQHITQSLAGRVGVTKLLPLSLSELGNPKDTLEVIFKGGYPEIYNLNLNPLDFYPSYIQTYLERDVRRLKNIGNIGQFQTFLRLCAGRIGQVINLTSLAQDCGISHTTARQWLTILEASYLIFFLQPFHKNFNKRLIKMPKLYFYDTGLACTLLGLEKASQLETHYLKGSLYENLIVLEILKNRFNRGLPANIYFWRDHTGHEIDLIAEWGGVIKAIEIKLSETFQPGFIKNLHYFKTLSSEVRTYLVYEGSNKGGYLGTELVPRDHLEEIFRE